MDNTDNPLNETFVIDLKTHPKNEIIDMNSHSTWGNSISFMNWEIREITGHMTPIPKKGDILVSKMKSGKKAVFRIIEIRPCLDPSDQFFGTVEDIGYIEDIQAALIELAKRLQELFKPMGEALTAVINSPGFLKLVLEAQEAKENEQPEAQK